MFLHLFIRQPLTDTGVEFIECCHVFLGASRPRAVAIVLRRRLVSTRRSGKRIALNLVANACAYLSPRALKTASPPTLPNIRCTRFRRAVIKRERESFSFTKSQNILIMFKKRGVAMIRLRSGEKKLFLEPNPDKIARF